MKKILGCVKKAVLNYDMIQDGDVLGVGLSGGKDSMLLLKALHLFQNFSPTHFELKAITIDLGFEDFNIDSITKFCDSLHIEHIIEKTHIGKVIFEEQQYKNPCGMCARMKRARLNKSCLEHHINKLALGHNGDDAIESLIMSMSYESRIRTFLPFSYMDKSKIYLIRPLIYAFEEDIKLAISKNNIPVITNPCPADEIGSRAYIKGVIRHMEENIPLVKKNLLACLEKTNQIEIWK